jgi:hypothetical protein
MDDLKSHLDRAVRAFEPDRGWYHGALGRVRRRRRTRRIASAAVGVAIFAASSGFLWTRVTPGITDVGGAVCPRAVSEVAPAPVGGGLADVSVSSGVEAWAVGPGEEADEGPRTTIQRWNGEEWVVEPSPGMGEGPTAVVQLTGVDAIAPDDVWAVGMSVASFPFDEANPATTVALHRDGKAWTRVPTPNPGTRENRLISVSGVASDDVWAVGHTVDGTRAAPMIQHWDGERWSLVPTPPVGGPEGGGSLRDVIAFASDDVWAVGSQQGEPLIERWDGSRWTVVGAPDIDHPGSLHAVSASSPDDIWAVGWTSSDGAESEPTPPVVFHFDGERWAEVVLPVRSDRYVVPLAVASAARGDVWVGGWTGTTNNADALDRFRPFVAHLDGSEWNVSHPGVDADGSIIEGAASDGRSVWFVGRRGGEYTPPDAMLTGARPLVLVARCSDTS